MAKHASVLGISSEACTWKLRASVVIANGLLSNQDVIVRSWAIMVSRMCWVFDSVSAVNVKESVQAK